MNSQIASIVGDSVLQSLKEEEERIDQTLQKYENLDEDDFERLREKRLQQMKLQSKKKAEWASQGHGEYSELPDQQSFFETTKRSKCVVVHFYRPSNVHCEVVDRHLTIMSKSHLEAKFCKINAEKAPFLVDRLKIWMLPTIVLCKDGETVHQIVGFDSLGGSDKFSTRMLEYAISLHQIIKYDGDIPEFDGDASTSHKTNLTRKEKKAVRQTIHYDSDLEESNDR